MKTRVFADIALRISRSFRLRMVRAVLFVLLSSSSGALSQVELGSPFQDHMVIQRDKPIVIWGWAAKGERVSVHLNGTDAETTADARGSWSAQLAGMKAGGPFELIVEGSSRVHLRDILIGDVWLCSGQSNMNFRLEQSLDGDEEIAVSNIPSLRLCTVTRTIADAPASRVKLSWSPSSPQTSGRFSAVAYYFGKRVAEELNIPIGLVHASWGGTPAECWVPRSVLEGDTMLSPILDRWNEAVERYPEALAEYERTLPDKMKTWGADSAAARRAGMAPPPRPQAPKGPGHRDTPAGQWNGMISPLIPMSVTGVIWYQGEANAGRAYQYRVLFPALIQAWRSAWSDERMPFYYVQLPNLRRRAGSGWPELREAQLMTQRVPNTGMAVTIDVGDPMDLHPTNKRPVGERLARLALTGTYQKNMVASGPTYAGYRRSGKRMYIRFSNAEEGLFFMNDDPQGFEIADSRRLFQPARAGIEGNEVVVWSDSIAEPIAVRYAWGENPEWSLIGPEKLPASPFRTDDWREVSRAKR